MGREWLPWGGGTSNRSTQRGRRTRGEEVINNEEAPPPGGCMCFQIFDLTHFQLALKPHHPSFLQQDREPAFLKGLEAPRNSLDLGELVVERKSVSSSLSSSSSTMKVDEQNLNIPVGIQIRTRYDSRTPRVSTSGTRARTDDISSECSSSSPAGTKTPTLVARLMGLDLLPENNSPRISISTNQPPLPKSQSKNKEMRHHQSNSKNRRFSSFESSDTNYITGTLSLPETPRISLARRSDVDHHHHHHHRLSLQINKENMGDAFEFSDSSTASAGRKMARSGRRRSYHQQENENQARSPGYYAKQIVKQVKESVSRKVGHDITNSCSSSIRRKDDQLAAKYDQVVLLKPKKLPSQVLAKSSHGDDDFSPRKQTTPSCSPRFRFLEPKSTSTKQPVNSSAAKCQNTTHSPRFSPLSPIAESTTVLPVKIVTKPQSSPEEQVQQTNSNTVQKGKGEKRGNKPPQACDAIRSKKEEQFVRSAAATNKANSADKKCGKTPLSNQLVNSTVPTILPLRKDPSPPPTKLLINQESDTHPWKRSSRELCCSWSQSSCKKLSTVQEMNRGRCNGDGDEFHLYIQRILKRTGLDKSTPLSLAKWYSSSHPLDPSIFHYLELFTSPNSTLTLRCNRKLIFQVVDELLVEILKTDLNFKPWVETTKRCQLMHGKELIDTLCTRIRSFPSANCQVLEDIDALIDKDMQISKIGMMANAAFEEQVESVVFEIERDIVEELVHDMEEDLREV